MKIEFKAYDTIEEKIITSCDIPFEIDWTLQEFCEVFLSGISDRYIPLQYTGLTDKNKVKIFAGDIIHRSKEHGVWTVEYHAESGSFQAYNQLNSLRCICQDTCCDIDNFIENGLSAYVHVTDDITFLCEVIGNQYKNPELLKRPL